MVWLLPQRRRARRVVGDSRWQSSHRHQLRLNMWICGSEPLQTPSQPKARSLAPPSDTAVPLQSTAFSKSLRFASTAILSRLVRALGPLTRSAGSSWSLSWRAGVGTPLWWHALPDYGFSAPCRLRTPPGVAATTHSFQGASRRGHRRRRLRPWATGLRDGVGAAQVTGAAGESISAWSGR